MEGIGRRMDEFMGGCTKINTSFSKYTWLLLYMKRKIPWLPYGEQVWRAVVGHAH